MAAPRSDDSGPASTSPAGRRGRRSGGEAPWLQPLGPGAAGSAVGSSAGAQGAAEERPWFEGMEPVAPATLADAPGGRAWFDDDVDLGPPTLSTPAVVPKAAPRSTISGELAAVPLVPAPAPAGPAGSVGTAGPVTSGAGAPPSTPPPGAAVPGRRRRAGKPRVRRVTRVVRRIDAWSVFKISLLFYVVLYAVLLVAGVLLWALAVSTGTVDNTENFIQELFGLDTFALNGRQLFEASWVIGAVLVVAGTGLNVAMAVLFNLISDLTGGVRVTVLEEEVVRRYPVDVPPR